MLETRKYNVSETGSVSVLRWVGKARTQLGPFERANPNRMGRMDRLGNTTGFRSNYEYRCSLVISTKWRGEHQSRSQHLKERKPFALAGTGVRVPLGFPVVILTELSWFLMHLAIIIIITTLIICVGWGSMLQAGRSRVRVRMKWIFLIYLILPAALRFWNRLSL
jgi:hypothetical protein